MMKPEKGQKGGTFGIDGEALLQATIESEKKRQEKETSQNTEKTNSNNFRTDSLTEKV